ncbi:UDP-N-acetylmuramoyl-tripeptide--D-alanyl-D-alanine ligase [Litoribrevibacter albus]|uniref:UDP-N-acetylmuramoyl-tripeptide--D-alanyl-D-alanine ligase n=1 Tax=Litoribrevibacter albus TaxID=1473156 RepID=A0AA37WA63_9GAMM|nr:UDP-N-acetylmuramoyl-tripeptide--D-alanyl-D-alanine ligase [Litoribrevibacter albus]GLQ33251.1 UDP-N-acetylmuramoyl-tripeptide--D-alanyl-D-alanine ligase [Litoribrevibacter albus]
MIKLSDLAENIDGTLIGKDASYESINTDSRSISQGQLFIALVGEHFDAHEYLAQVKEKGACAVVVSKPVDCDLPQIVVRDTLDALGQIGSYMASLTRARFVALTGSCGKTTTKEMIRLALSSAGQVYATRGNLNNHIGVPLTLSEVALEDDFAVIEMGASGVGEIQYTVQMTHPEVVLITNASDAHLEGFGSLRRIVEAKGEIVRFAPENSVVVLNQDDPNFSQWIGMANDRKVVSFSSQADSSADVCLLEKQLLEGSGYRLDVQVGSVNCQFELHVSGAHMIQNALATLAVVYALGLDLTSAAEALSGFQPVKGRFSPIRCQSYTVWDDTYNANPQSVKAAISTIAEYKKPAWLVLGAMAELGDHAEEAHKDIGRFTSENGFERVYAIGPFSESVINHPGFSGTAYNKTDMDVLLSDLERDINASGHQDLQILVKGSRSAGMERVVRALVELDTKE